MTLLLYMAVSIDGIAALDKNRGIREYSSDEDHDFFISESKKCDAVIMGKNTSFCRISGVTNIILTHNAPLESEKGRTDLIDENRVYLSGSADEIYKKIQAMGIRRAALLGGPATNAQFLRAGLVDEIFLTVEPVTIGRGIHFLNEPLESRWILADSRVLNERGTIVLHYVLSL